jgi:hypothetical protein
MIRAIRTTTACLVLAFTLLASLPRPLLADDGTGTALRRDDPGAASARPGRFDFEKFLLTQTPPTPVPGHSFSDTAPTPQASHGWSSYSTAKKTWIIVGIAVGAAAIAVAVSSHHGSHSGGGGGGY